MNRRDRELGMDRPITRRDFLNGVAVVVTGSLLTPDLAEACRALGIPIPQFAPEKQAGCGLKGQRVYLPAFKCARTIEFARDARYIRRKYRIWACSGAA